TPCASHASPILVLERDLGRPDKFSAEAASKALPLQHLRSPVLILPLPRNRVLADLPPISKHFHGLALFLNTFLSCFGPRFADRRATEQPGAPHRILRLGRGRVFAAFITSCALRT